MGLAPYGKPIYKEKILENMVEVFDNGFFKLNMKYFNFEIGLTMINKKFENYFKKKLEKKLNLLKIFIKI